jgi:biofilm PGA synthesis N-glycosyltransferase PgaC
MPQRLLLITPVHNEAAHLELVADAMTRQTRPPDLWVLVEDNSSDDTPEILRRLAERIDFVRVASTAELPPAAPVKDRLAAAAPPRTFNLGLNGVDWESFTHIAKLDGDIELPADYFELLLGRFARDSSLGLAGGVLRERDGEGGWSPPLQANDYHVRGAMKCYTRECLQAIGGIQERLGWDTIDEIYARMRGYRTRVFGDLIALHHRPWGSADGTLRGRARHGTCAYIVHFTLPWVALRAFKVARSRPRVLSGLAFLYGFLDSAARRVPRVEDPEFRTFVRHELRERARSEITERAGRRRRGLVPASSGER